MSRALHPNFSDLLGSPLALSSTPTLGFLNAYASSFLIHQHLCYLWDVMPCQWSPGASHPLPREAEDIPRNGNRSKHMPPPIYIAWLQPIYYNSRSVFIHINIGKAFTCGENFDNKYRAAAKLISSHEKIKQPH